MLHSSKLSSRFEKSDENSDLAKDKPKKFMLSKSVLQSVKSIQQFEDNINQPENPKNAEKSDIPDDMEADLKKTLLEKIDSIPVWFDYNSEQQKNLIKSFVDNKLDSENIILNTEEKETLIDKLFTSIMGFGPLDYLIVQDNVDAVFVNGTSSVHIEIGGRVLNTEMNINEKQMCFIINNISAMSGVRIDNSRNIWDLRFDNLCITVIMPSVSQKGYNITIRKQLPCSMSKLLEKNMMTKEIFDFLVSIVDAKKNVVISGEINSGKTTLLDTLITSTLLNRRVALFEKKSSFTCEGSAFMKFLTDRCSADYKELLSDILKTIPDYVISDFNVPMPEISELSGCIFTLRASSVEAAISKLTAGFISEEHLPEKYAKARVYTSYDYIVQINQTKDGVKRITSIVELKPARTAALSVKVIAKFVDEGDYVTEIPQPLTSIRAESLISEAGSMSARFLKQN